MLIANECLPRGGKVEITASKQGDAGEVIVTATGPRGKLKDATFAALKGEGDELTGHTIQPTLTGLLARQGGVELSARETAGETENKIELIARSASFQL